jgi:CHASE1-domain containing sensor protein
LDKAKSSGQTSIAPRVKFIQDEEGEDAGSGLVMFIPVYQLGNPLDTPELRREALKGFICGPVRFSDFIYGIVKKLPQDVSFEIYAGGKADQDALLFDSVKTERLRVPPDFKPLFSKDILVNDYGCAFLFRFKSLPAFARGIDRHSSYAILGLCVLASLLLTTLAYLSLNIGRKELDIAGKNFDAFFNTVEDLLFALDLNGA